ncbi:hypothetical protein [Bacillus sp. B-jedd]|uniref:hypothetical protein n=1 Tax=Bacillus sp. B-jedd TaxID=1476857 RepID=UPI0006621A1B|nr:hypothetical protein [Bacillus sp. B-jedd]
MGSRIMHGIIANLIAEQLNINDFPSFLLGGIAPDAVSPSEKSHFFRGDVSDYSRRIGYGEFLQKYRALQSSPFIQGYYAHLIADEVWLSGFYLPWLRNRLEADPGMLQLYHEDFCLLNGQLLEHFGVKQQLNEALQADGWAIDLEEVNSRDVAEFIPYVLGDLEYSEDSLAEPLKVFTFSQMIGYIETSVDRGLREIRKLGF